MSEFQVREVAEALGVELDGSERPLTDAIQRLRDEVSVLSVKGHGQQSRELALILTHLDNARLWAMEFGLSRRTHILVVKADYIAALEATKDSQPSTVSTVSTDTESET